MGKPPERSSEPVAEPLGAPASLPVTILTGFLGSGKTTVLNALLRAPHGLRLAVVINEFGEIGIDRSMVAGDAAFVELDNGCLCCAVNEDLEKTLLALRVRGGFDQLVIETSGIADPLPVAWTFSRPGLSETFRVDAIVTVVDAEAFPKVAAEHLEAREQVARADLVLLAKLDLSTDHGVAAEGGVRALNSVAPIVRLTPGKAPWSLMLTRDQPSRMRDLPADPEHTHDVQFVSRVLELPDDLGPIPELTLEDLLAELPTSAFRIKGVVPTDTFGPTLVNGVGGRFELRPLPKDAPRPERRWLLVVIGRDLDVPSLDAWTERLRRAGSPS